MRTSKAATRRRQITIRAESPDRSRHHARDGILDVGYGHYEDDLVKIDGEWLFAKRRIYNEGNEAWAAPPGNPAW